MAAQSLHAAPPRFRRIFPAAFTIIAGVCLTIAAFLIIRNLERERTKLDFESIALSRARSLQERIHAYEESLYTLRSLFVASDRVSQFEFDMVCGDLRTRQAGVHQFRWLPLVDEKNRTAIEQEARAEVHSAWTIRDSHLSAERPVETGTTRDFYLPILFASPLPENSADLGADQFQVSDWRMLRRTIETGQISATTRTMLETGGDPEFGWIICLAVYQNGSNPTTPAERWRHLKGVLQGEFRLSQLLAANSDLNQALDFALTDETPDTAEAELLSFSRGILRTGPLSSPLELNHPMKVEHPIPSGGRLWKLHVQPDRDWLATKRTGFPFVVLAFGGWLTAFLAASIHSSRRRSETIFRLVATRTAQLRDAEERLREDVRQRERAEQRYHAFVQQSTEAIWRFEMDPPMPINWPEEKQILFIHEHAYLAECNDACARMYGCDRSEEMIGTPLSDILPLDDVRNREHLRAYIRGGFQITDSESCELDRQGRSHIFLNNVIGVIEDGQFVRGWGTQRDITEQRGLEIERKAASERLRLAIEAVHLGLWEWDLKTDKLSWNDEFVEMHGLTRETFGGTYKDFEKMAHPDDLGMVEETIERALAEPDETFECEYRMIRADGAELWLYTRGRVRKDEDGEAVKMFGAAIDITSRKLGESERTSMERKLQDTQKLESLGILAGGIAHDFNNLLTGVLGNASLARMDLPESSSAQPCLKQIEQAALRAADLCRQMLAYSGKGRFVVQRVNLNHLIEESVALLEVSISKDATLKLCLADPLPSVEADVTQLRQILMNLVMNASDAIGGRTGLIEIKTGVIEANSAYLASAHLAPVLPAGPYVFLEVKDTGMGMDAETQKRIFDPFFTTKFTGRGLGLAAVLGIVRGHQGAMKVSSQPGNGSTFTLLLPKAEGEAEETNPADAQRGEWRGEGRILVIDDEEMVRRVATQMVKSMGFECVAAVHGQQGVDLFAAHSKAFDAVLLDLTMPKMDGGETFVELRRLQPKIPIILMSGYNEQDAISRLGNKDMAGFLQKPIQRDQLQRLLRRIFEKRKKLQPAALA